MLFSLKKRVCRITLLTLLIFSGFHKHYTLLDPYILIIDLINRTLFLQDDHPASPFFTEIAIHMVSLITVCFPSGEPLYCMWGVKPMEEPKPAVL